MDTGGCRFYPTHALDPFSFRRRLQAAPGVDDSVWLHREIRDAAESFSVNHVVEVKLLHACDIMPSNA